MLSLHQNTPTKPIVSYRHEWVEEDVFTMRIIGLIRVRVMVVRVYGNAQSVGYVCVFNLTSFSSMYL